MTASTRSIAGRGRKAPASAPAKAANAKAPAPAKTPAAPAKTPAAEAPAKAPMPAKAAATAPAPAPAATTTAAGAAPAEATAEAPDAPAEGEAPAGGLPESGPVADLLSVMTDMMTLLTEEVQALKQRSPEVIKDLQQRKEYLASAYESHVKSLRADPEPLEALDDAARAELRAATESFDDALRRNGRALAAAHDVAQELLDKTVHIVKDHRRNIGGYSPGGVPRGESERYATPATFDRNL